MSADEDTELRDLVAQTLEANGVLGKIRAQLRASVFLALEEQESIQAHNVEERMRKLGKMIHKNKTPFANAELKKFVNTKNGRLVAGLVREFLEHFNMEFTLAVFDPESNIGDQYEGRGSLARDLDIVDSEDTMKQPLLVQVLRQGAAPDCGRRRSSSSEDPPPGVTPEVTPGNVSGSATEMEKTDNQSQELPTKLIVEAREKFDLYDTDNSGTIEKDELRALFVDIFPGFHRNMIERYVNDEFRAADIDFSNAIDFEEFLTMYKRLFVLCKTSVSSDVTDLVSPRVGPGSRQLNQLSTGRKGAGGSNAVDSKNKKNLDSDKPNDMKFSQKSTNSFFNDDDADDDPFFDDPIPSNNNTKSFTSTRSRSPTSPRRADSPTSPRPSKIPTKIGNSDKPKKDVKFDTQKTDKRTTSGGGLTSLAGLPSLAPGENSKPPKSPDLEKDIKAIDRRMTDLGFDVPDDDYDDDFESSKSEKTSRSERTSRSEKSTRSDRSERSKSLQSEKSVKKHGSVSPFGATPRSARSDHNLKSLEDELEEEIEEDLSGGEDLLKSDNSGMDDLTTDRTVSPDNQSNAIDYMEDVMVP